MNVGDQIQVRIEKMSLHGGAVARHDGLVLFVEFAAPGDLLRVEITDLKKNHGFARILEILEPSAERKPAPCPVFGRCGGCGWQHLSDDSQKKWKSELLHETLRKAWPANFEFLPFVASPRSFRYRNRIQLKKDGSQIGYFAKGSHELVAIDDCPLAEDAVIEAFPLLKKQASVSQTPKKTGFENWEISLNENSRPEIHSLEDRELFFSQVNRFTNELLIQEVLDWAAESDWSSYWDLYCGSGNFTFPLAERFPKKSGVGVELSESGLRKARAESQRRGWSPKRLEFFRSDVGLFFNRMSPPDNSLVLVDPPRAGLDERVVKALALGRAQRVLYVSCNPMSLARDLQRLRQFAPDRWRLKRVRGFDMFPQTEHVETLVEWELA